MRFKKRIAIRDTRTPETACPTCGKKLDAATSLDDAQPKPGAVALCAYCGQVLVFSDDLTQRAATPAEIAEFEEHLNFRALRQLNAKMRQARRRDSAPNN